MHCYALLMHIAKPILNVMDSSSSIVDATTGDASVPLIMAVGVADYKLLFCYNCNTKDNVAWTAHSNATWAVTLECTKCTVHCYSMSLLDIK